MTRGPFIAGDALLGQHGASKLEARLVRGFCAQFFKKRMISVESFLTSMIEQPGSEWSFNCNQSCTFCINV